MMLCFARFYLKVSVWGLFVGSTTAALHAFDPAKYISTKQPKPIFLFEGEALKDFTRNLKSFYFSLRKDQKSKQIEWNFLMQLVNTRVGLNLFGEKQLRKTGIDNRKKFGIILYEPKSRRKNIFQLLIPAKNPKKLYAWSKRNFLRKNKQSKKSVQKIQTVKELKKGEFLQVVLQENQFYLARGKNHISFSNDKNIALSGVQTHENNLRKSEAYQLFAKSFSIPKKGRLGIFFATNEIFSLLKQVPWIPYFKISHPPMNMILANTRFIGGEINSHSKQFSLLMRHALKKDFFKKNDKKMIDFQLDFLDHKAGLNPLGLGSLKLDHNTNKKALHLSGLFHPERIWSYLDRAYFLNLGRILPVRGAAQTFKPIFQPHLKGNISIIVWGLLPGRFSLSLKDMDFVGSLGLKSGSADKIKKNLERKLKTAFTRYRLRLTKEKIKNQYDLWGIQWSESIRRQNILRKFYILFYKDQFNIFSGRKNIARFLGSKGPDIIQQNKATLSAGSKESSGVILVDIDRIYQLVSKSNLGMLFPQYVGYIKELKDLVIHSFQKENSVFSELKLIIK